MLLDRRVSALHAVLVLLCFRLNKLFAYMYRLVASNYDVLKWMPLVNCGQLAGCMKTVQSSLTEYCVKTIKVCFSGYFVLCSNIACAKQFTQKTRAKTR